MKTETMSALGRKPIIFSKDLTLWLTNQKEEKLEWSREEDFLYYEDPQHIWFLHAKGPAYQTATQISPGFRLKVYLPEAMKRKVSNGKKIPSEGRLPQMVLEPLLEESKRKRIRNQERKRKKSRWGSHQRQIQSDLTGASQGQTLQIALSGIGYKAFKEKEKLILKLGYSHEIHLGIPKSLQLEIGTDPKPVSGGGENQWITLKGPKKKDLGDFADLIRSFRPPEPYKGKGVLLQTSKNLKKLRNFRKEGKQKTS